MVRAGNPGGKKPGARSPAARRTLSSRASSPASSRSLSRSRTRSFTLTRWGEVVRPAGRSDVEAVIRTGEDWSVAVSPGLLEDLADLLGESRPPRLIARSLPPASNGRGNWKGKPKGRKDLSQPTREVSAAVTRFN